MLSQTLITVTGVLNFLKRQLVIITVAQRGPCVDAAGAGDIKEEKQQKCDSKTYRILIYAESNMPEMTNIFSYSDNFKRNNFKWTLSYRLLQLS